MESPAEDVNVEMLDADGAPVSRYLPGDQLPGRLPAWERLGVGYRCETWLAWSPEMWGPAVVKFPRPHQLDHPRARASLDREVAALAGNLHPALPRLYEDGTGAPMPYLVFEHIDGIALDDEIDEHGAFAAAEVALLATQLLAALRTVHARGLAHVDIKPANVMLRDGRPLLIDFGSARVIGTTQPSGKLIGSPGYAAPDLEAGAPISAAMDVYGLGVALHEALTGDVAFDPDLAASERPTPPPLPATEVTDLVLRMLAADPGDRPDVDAALNTFADVAESAGHSRRPSWVRS
jgi:serine/threonine protein kinase